MNFQNRVALINKNMVMILTTITESFVLLLNTLFQGLGALVITVLVLLVEIHRIQAGFLFFEVSSLYAYLGAIAFVLINFYIDGMIVITERNENYKSNRYYQFSLRLWVERLGYIFNIFGDDFEPQPKSPAAKFYMLQRALTAAIIVIALLGSLAPQLQALDIAYYQGFWQILTQSETYTFAGVLAATLATWVLVISAQVLSKHITEQALDIIQKSEDVVIQSEIEIATEQNEHPISFNGIIPKRVQTILDDENKYLLTTHDNLGTLKAHLYNASYTIHVKKPDGTTSMKTYANPEEFTNAIRSIADLRSWKLKEKKAS